jgi:phytoene/squalene synthetase
MELILSLRNQVNGAPDEAALMRMAAEVGSQQADSDEKVLLESLGAALTVLSQLSESDREAVRDIVTTLTKGMEFDLHTFPDESSGQIVSLREFSELDQYTYMVAGCVGEFWTKMTYVHVPGTFTGNPEVVLSRGIRFGKALQMTNVLRDCGKDLRIGRCYLPSTMLDQFGLSPQDLLLPKTSLPARPLLFELVGKTLDHQYTSRKASPTMQKNTISWPFGQHMVFLTRETKFTFQIRIGIKMYRYFTSSFASSGRICPALWASLNSSRTSPVFPIAFRKSIRYWLLNPTTSGS